VREAGKVVTRERIMDEVWDVNWFGSTRRSTCICPGCARARRPAADRHRPSRRVPLRALMRRQLIATTALIALAAILVLGIPLGLVESARARGDALGRLEREADGSPPRSTTAHRRG